MNGPSVSEGRKKKEETSESTRGGLRGASGRGYTGLIIKERTGPRYIFRSGPRRDRGMDDGRMVAGESWEEMRRGMEQGGINAEKFGSFLALLRRERKMTQRELAEKLFVTNKAVSKWERGLSLPDISLLEPLADTFGVTVTELLHGERFQSAEEAAGQESTEIVNARLMERLEVNAEENRQALRRVKKKRALYYVAGAVIGLTELAMLYLQGYRADITAEQVSLDVLLIVALPLLFGLWFFLFIREKLPTYYDTERICFYSDGIFRMNVPGVYFNNRNWPFILRAGRAWCLLTPVLYPPLYLVLRLLIPLEIWRWMSLYVTLVIILGGLFLPMYITARKKM